MVRLGERQAAAPRRLFQGALCLGLLALFLAALPSVSYATDPPPPLVFWSTAGPVGVERPAGERPADWLAALLAGPTASERAQGLWSAIPAGTELAGLDVSADGRVTVRLRLPPEALARLDAETLEIIEQQIAWTLEPLNWQELYVQTWDADAGAFVDLASFLPPLDAPRKETVASGEEMPTPAYIGQPPASGQGQPQGALSGKTVYVSAGHGWLWNSTVNGWRTQRPPYPNPPYVGPIIEDFNNAEAVNQYLLQYLWNAGATVIPVRERDMNSAEAVVDDGDGGFATSGTWNTTTGSGYGSDYRWASTVVSTPTASVTWTVALPADGQYAVYVWYRPGTNRAADARYTVHHAGGETTVTVDQRHHGSTWHYLGTYGFLAGTAPRLTLTNRSSATGTVVIADAVRIGGGTFSSLSGIVTSAPYPPNTPWWETAAYYYTQRMGMPAADGDVVARPIYARWEHAGTGEDAVYVSWHTNGISGYQTTSRGTISFIHNGAGRPVTPGSAALRDAIHNELVNDLRAGWDPTWPASTGAMNLGELRELYDPDPAVALPGALIEVAYHDHPGDTDALKEPAFELLAARAIYQGIVRYFAQKDGVAAHLLPEPPTHLAAQNLGGGAVRLRWRPSPVNAIGGDAATGYRVYTSTNGIGWSNGVAVAGTSFDLSGLPTGQLLFVRVTATNAGGESFPTETLAVRVGSAPSILLVSGFDRLDRYMLVPDYYAPTAQTHMRMFLGQMNRYDYVIQHGWAISYPFDSASNEAVESGDVSLLDYGIVDWIVGEESTQDETLSAAEQGLLKTFIDGGGSLFISGAEIGWDLDHLGSSSDRAFYNTYLRAAYAGDDAATYQVAPVAGRIFAGLPAFRFDTLYNADYPDQLTPLGGAQAALIYSGGAGGTAAIQYANGCQRLVYFGFPFETIETARRAEVMGRALDFLGACGLLPLETTITSPQDGGIYLRFPLLSGTAHGGWGVERVEVAVRRQADGLWWDGTGWVTATAWLTATGSATWSYTLTAPLAAGWYDVRARAWDVTAQVDTTPAEAAMQVITPNSVLFLPLVATARECQELVVNGGFEASDGWVLNNLAVYDTTRFHSGARSMRVGIPPGQPGVYAFSSIAQTMALPAGGSAQLSLWLYPIGEALDPGDWHYIALFDQWNNYYLLDKWTSNGQAWEQRAYDLSAYAGRTVTIYIGTQNDGDNETSALYIDDVSLMVCP